MHNLVAKHIAKYMSEWPRHKSNHEVQLAKAQTNNLAKAVCTNANNLLEQADTDYKNVTESYTHLQVTGKGCVSKSTLGFTQTKIEAIFKINKDSQDLMKALTALI